MLNLKEKDPNLSLEDFFFHEITLEDQNWIKEKASQDYLDCCDYAFANNFIWKKVYSVEVAKIKGCAIVRFMSKKDNELDYSFPFGNGDKEAAIRMLADLVHKEGRLLELNSVTDFQRNFLLEHFPGRFAIEPMRDKFDYVYLKEDLAGLKGKKYQQKRNHIHRFTDAGDWSYEPITQDNIRECMEMETVWIGGKEDKWEDGVLDEESAVRRALKYFKELGLVGGVLRKAGKVVAFTIGERLNSDTMVVHIEKAYADIQGAYPMINQQFILHEGGPFTYINREEDTGDPGLRKAKLSYHPFRMAKKYYAVESDVTYAVSTEKEQIFDLWKTVFGDEDAYIRMYLEDRFTEETTLVIREDGRIVSMIHMLPLQLQTGETRLEALYIYAVATHPDYRGRGYSRKLIRTAMERYGKILVLRPADAGLMDFYGKQGFTVCGEAEQFVLEADHLRKTELVKPMAEAAPAAYAKARNQSLKERTAFIWDEAALSYAMEENRYGHGMSFSGNTGVLMCRPGEEASVVQVIECTMDAEERDEYLGRILADQAAEKAVYENQPSMIWIPEEERETLEGVDFGKIYMNLVMG